MKNEKLLEAIGQIDDQMIMEASEIQKPKKQWLKWCAGAACLVAAVLAGVILIPDNAAPVELPQLPMLTVSQNESGAWGYEAYCAYDISELVSSNPWSEKTDLTVLPVYQNVQTGDRTEMEAWAEEIAGRLGISGDWKITWEQGQADKITGQMMESENKLTLKADGVTVDVDSSMTAQILLEPAVALPEGYDFHHYSSYENIASVAEFLKQEYKELIGFAEPQINICGGDYDFYGRQMYQIEFFEGAAAETEQILRYHFNRVSFYCDDDGKLFLIRLSQQDLSGKVADYPIITSSAAEALLTDGKYITSVPYEMPGKRYIRKGELVYRTGKSETYWMPYYRFYVELPEQELSNGLKTYAAYYVPAVHESYISNMPVWDGSFNG